MFLGGNMQKSKPSISFISVQVPNEKKAQYHAAIDLLASLAIKAHQEKNNGSHK